MWCISVAEVIETHILFRTLQLAKLTLVKSPEMWFTCLLYFPPCSLFLYFKFKATEHIRTHLLWVLIQGGDGTSTGLVNSGGSGETLWAERREITALWRAVKWKWIGFVNVLIKAEKRSVKNVSAGCDSNTLKCCLPGKVKCNDMERTLSGCFFPERAGKRSNTFYSLDLSHLSDMLVMSQWHQQQQSASLSLQPPSRHFA